MDLPLCISEDLNYSVKLPHCFLNYLLGEGYQFDQGVLCLKLSNAFGHCHCGMTEFKEGQSIDIGHKLNTMLNTIDGEYVHVDRVEPKIPTMIKIQGHTEKFGDVKGIKGKLESLFVEARIINLGQVFQITIDDAETDVELFSIAEILGANNIRLDWGLTVDADIKIDFLPTIESIEMEKQKKEREELARRGFVGEGQRLGGNVTDRLAWLRRFDKDKNMS